MSYVPDLTQYCFPGLDEALPTSVPMVAIGWLEAGHDYPVGTLPDDVLERVYARLVEYATYRVRGTRGFHPCDLCGGDDAIFRHPAVGLLSTAEIWIRGANCWYCCPNLIIHYIEAHQYLPAADFIDALLNGPAPGSDAYHEALDQLCDELEWDQRFRPS